MDVLQCQVVVWGIWARSGRETRAVRASGRVALTGKRKNTEYSHGLRFSDRVYIKQAGKVQQIKAET